MLTKPAMPQGHTSSKAALPSPLSSKAALPSPQQGHIS